MTTIREWLTENRNNYDDRTRWMKDCAGKLNVSFKSVRNVAAQVWSCRDKVVGRKISSDVMRPDEFLSSVDVVKHIMDFLDTEVKDGYIEDEKLRRRFEMSISKWNEIKRLVIWDERKFVYIKPNGSKATVWSSAHGIELARKTISMARYEL